MEEKNKRAKVSDLTLVIIFVILLVGGALIF